MQKFISNNSDEIFLSYHISIYPSASSDDDNDNDDDDDDDDDDDEFLQHDFHSCIIGSLYTLFLFPEYQRLRHQCCV